MSRIRGGTPRDMTRRTDGDLVARVASMLGTPLLPWQRHVVDVAGEIDPETGSYFYDTVILSTPRQCGKSTLVDAKDTRNALKGRNRFIYYLAQTGKDAGEHFKKYLKTVMASPLAPVLSRPYMGAGDLRLPFLNGSVIRPMSVTKVAGHGVQGDMITLDEAFSLSLETGNSIIDGFLPTTATRFRATGVQPQLWITSTEGTADSTFFNERLDACRAGDISRRTCWFDYGIPDDVDSDDLDAVMQYHPAAGLLWDRGQLRDFREQFGDNAAGFARAYGNRRDLGVADRLIDADTWQSATVPQLEPSQIGGRPLMFAVAVDVDATHSSIAVAFDDGDGHTVTQLLAVLDGTASVVGEAKRLACKYRAAVTMDTKGPGAVVYDVLKDDMDLQLNAISGTDYMSLGQSYVSGMQNGTVLHAADDDLDQSAVVCARTWVGDSWRITRRGSSGLTSPLEACMLAAWGLRHDLPSGLQIF